MTRVALAAAVAITVAAAPAAAQSRRYPATARDPDDVAEHESGFWAQVADPGRARYALQVRDALLLANADRRRAIALMREAALSRPAERDAWAYLGLLTDQVRDWTGCAEGYGKAAAIDPAWELRPRQRAGAAPIASTTTNPYAPILPGSGVGVALSGGRSVTIAHAVCRGRAGDVAGAIAVLEAVVARGESMDELWLRLGEAYLAAGRLDDAVAALGEALARREGPDAAWLLALAHDRARRASAAEAAALTAQRLDPDATMTTGANRPPPITPGEREYLLALEALTPSAGEPPTPPTPERALYFFRRFLDLAPPSSPWRARASEHLRALASLDLAARASVTGGSLDRAALERALRPRLPALRACLASTPSALVELTITVLGPTAGPARPAPPRETGTGTGRPSPSRFRSREPDDDRPPIAQQPGVAAHADLYDQARRADVDLAVECIEKVGAGVALPRPPAGSWSTVRIPIAAP